MGSQPISSGFFWERPGIFRSRLWREAVSACPAGVKPRKLNTAIVIPNSRLDPSPLHFTREIKIKIRIRRLTHPEGMGQQTVLEFLAPGDSVEDVLEEYPKPRAPTCKRSLITLLALWATTSPWCGLHEGLAPRLRMDSWGYVSNLLNGKVKKCKYLGLIPGRHLDWRKAAI
jgi:hypothetical protein